MESDPIAAAWRTHNAILLKLVGAIRAEWLSGALASRGRTVRSHLAHMHNVRLMWLKASAQDLLAPLTKLDADTASHEDLVDGLTQSGEAVARLVARASETGKIKGFKGSPAAFLGYLVAHEWYHAGKADMILRHIGHAMDDKLHYALWEDWARV